MAGFTRPVLIACTVLTATALTVTVGAYVHAGAAPVPVVSAASGSSAVPASSAVSATVLPPVNATFDYQIGAAYPPPPGVRVVSRDRQDPIAANLYNICYVNAFQVQPDEIDWWQSQHDDLLLRDSDGDYVVDGDWNEILLDISTSAKRAAIAGIVQSWFDGCARAGYQAIEPDNIDSYERSKGLLGIDDAVAYLELLAPHAHDMGLAIGQKNTTDLGTRGRSAGLDFAIAEECGRYHECDYFTGVYGDNVIVIEYTDTAFTKACSVVGDEVSVVRRDVGVTAPGSGTYRYGSC